MEYLVLAQQSRRFSFNLDTTLFTLVEKVTIRNYRSLLPHCKHYFRIFGKDLDIISLMSYRSESDGREVLIARSSNDKTIIKIFKHRSGSVDFPAVIIFDNNNSSEIITLVYCVIDVLHGFSFMNNHYHLCQETFVKKYVYNKIAYFERIAQEFRVDNLRRIKMYQNHNNLIIDQWIRIPISRRILIQLLRRYRKMTRQLKQ